MQVLDAGQFLQSSGTESIVHVGFNGAFDVTIVVDPSWSVGPHTIYATEQFTSRKATLKFTEEDVEGLAHVLYRHSDYPKKNIRILAVILSPIPALIMGLYMFTRRMAAQGRVS